jgi:biofilm PGA synthesis N-glycosyltransferase PgaC
MHTSVARYILITPARDEIAFIESSIQSVITQSILPLKWFIVSDGSSDGTDDVVIRYAADHPWIELIQIPKRRERHFAGKVNAFNAGYARAKDLNYDVIGCLDADITFDQEYMEFLLGKFAENPQLGVAGTPFREESRQYDFRFTAIEHVSGACQLFRRECFEEIGGYIPIKIGGIDLVAGLTARMKGWQTRSFPEKTCVHHRKMGSAKQNAWLRFLKGGQGDYMLGGHPVWEPFHCVYQMTRPPFFLGGVLRLIGFFWALLSGTEKVLPSELIQFRRTEQMRRLYDFLKSVISLRFLSGSFREQI